MQSFGTSSLYVPQTVKYHTGLLICSRHWLIANDHKSKRKKSVIFLTQSETWKVMKYKLSLMQTRRISLNLISKRKKKKSTILLAKLMTGKRENLFKIHVLHSQSSHKQYPLSFFLGRKGILRASANCEFNFSLS